MKKTFMSYERKISQLAAELDSLAEAVKSYTETLPGNLPLPPLLRKSLALSIDNTIDYAQAMCNLIKEDLIHEEKEHVLLIKWKIEEHVRENYQKRIPQTAICDHIGASSSILCKFFKKYYGCTFVSYLNKYRVEQAMQKLKTSNESITDIAYGCGFDCLNWFNAKFKENIGMTPGEYRDLNRID